MANSVGKIDDEILAVAKYLDELKDVGVSVRKMTATELNTLKQVKISNEIGSGVNIAKLDAVMDNGNSFTKYATSGYPDPRYKNILKEPSGVPHPKKGNSVMGEYVQHQKRFNDTEVKLLEDFALTNGAKPNVKGQVFDNIKGKVSLYTRLCPCSSCASVIKGFKKMFPKVELEIITTTKTTFK